MIPFIILWVALLVFRGIGALGVPLLESWAVSMRYALAVMFLFTASSHFTTMKQDLINMVPTWVPYAKQMVTFTGICEILGAIGILIPFLQRAAGIGLILLLIAVLPANINAAQSAVTLRGRPATPLWIRVPMQLIYIGLILWSTLGVM